MTVFARAVRLIAAMWIAVRERVQARADRRAYFAAPLRPWDEQVVCDTLVLLPTWRLHESGFGVFEAVAVTDDGKGGRRLCKVTVCSDVLALGGIGGCGHSRVERYGRHPDAALPVPWQIDLLPCGLFQLFAHDHRLLVGSAMSTLEVYAVERKAKAAT